MKTYNGVNGDRDGYKTAKRLRDLSISALNNKLITKEEVAKKLSAFKVNPNLTTE